VLARLSIQIHPMPEILNQHSARAAQKLAFCYLCGEAFDDGPGRMNHPDHVPPKRLFAAADRNFPVKVSSHESCNNQLSGRDEVIAQLVAAVHGKYPSPGNVKLRFKKLKTESIENEYFGVVGVHIEHEVIRWVRGFHAALYGEFLVDQPSSQFCVSLPFPRLLSDETLTDGLLRNHVSFVAEIKRNRLAGRLDRIISNREKCVYECVWSKSDDGQDVCIFALKLYEWSRLADRRLDRRSCVGLYHPREGRPKTATQATTLEMPIAHIEVLDAFAK
jgi:hypothetical protein